VIGIIHNGSSHASVKTEKFLLILWVTGYVINAMGEVIKMNHLLCKIIGHNLIKIDEGSKVKPNIIEGMNCHTKKEYYFWCIRCKNYSYALTVNYGEKDEQLI